MTREQYHNLLTWQQRGTTLDRGELIRMALYRKRMREKRRAAKGRTVKKSLDK